MLGSKGGCHGGGHDGEAAREGRVDGGHQEDPQHLHQAAVLLAEGEEGEGGDDDGDGGSDGEGAPPVAEPVVEAPPEDPREAVAEAGDDPHAGVEPVGGDQGLAEALLPVDQEALEVEGRGEMATWESAMANWLSQIL